MLRARRLYLGTIEMRATRANCSASSPPRHTPSNFSFSRASLGRSCWEGGLTQKRVANLERALVLLILKAGIRNRIESASFPLSLATGRFGNKVRRSDLFFKTPSGV